MTPDSGGEVWPNGGVAIEIGGTALIDEYRDFGFDCASSADFGELLS